MSLIYLNGPYCYFIVPIIFFSGKENKEGKKAMDGKSNFIAVRLGLNEFFLKIFVELHRNSGLFLQSFGYFWEGLQ